MIVEHGCINKTDKSGFSIVKSGGFVQINQLPYYSCKRDTEERYLEH